ncbi:MAG: valine--tRNA ligase [bacterium]|nr:valine--tRNA ligase [bacterium]
MSSTRRKSVKPYNPAGVEAKIYRRWERASAFTPAREKPRRKKAFSVVIPPPNITGSLHMGHALNSTMQDALVRYHRMRGDDTVWVPGTDHAGIATQNVVERELKKEGLTRHDLGREKFVERVWAWKEQYGSVITEQLRMLGCSADWSKARFTLDADYSRAVQEAFLHYANKGLIYRGERIVNWCPRCASAISDLEVEHREEDAVLYTIRYGPLALATVRPETKFGDTGVAVHPKDERYRQYVGKEIEIETVLGPATLRVVADEAVDPQFGTGVVKVTPAHDFTDFEIGSRHDLPPRQVITEEGRMNDHAGPFAGMTVTEARAAVVEALKNKGLLVKEEPYRHTIGVCSRCGTAIEPLISKQWFVKMAPLAKPAIEMMEKGLIAFHPSRWQKATIDWLRGVKDWCISRQLWWGHRLPVWYCQTGNRLQDGHVVFSIVKPKVCPECGGKEFVQDPDVLDTWFSSALWPFAVFGWPEATADLQRFYPTSVLVTDKGILNLWVVRMMFSGLEFMNPAKFLPARVFGSRSPAKQVPFRDVIIHPTVLNLKGQRMSKSLGTGVDPVELIREFGADATRFGLLLQSQEGQQALHFDPNAVRTGRNFVNKIWNVSRFVQATGNRQQGTGKRRATQAKLQTTSFDQWISRRFRETRDAVTEALDSFRFGDATRLLHDFIWDDLADWYVEVSKVPGMTTPRVLREVLQGTLKLLHPFLPFVTEELWKTFGDNGMLIAAPWPSAARRRDSSRASAAAARHVRHVQEIVQSFRSARTLLGLPTSRTLRIHIRGAGAPLNLFPAVEFLARCRIDACLPDRQGGSGPWVRLSTTDSRTLEVHQEDLSAVDFAARRGIVEQRAVALRQQVEVLERRLGAMRGGAPAAVIAEAERLLAARRAELAEQERSLTTLTSLSA